MDMLSKYGMADCKPISMPLDVNAKLSAEKGDVVEDVTMYRKIVGSLIYLTITRPDLSYSVGLESQFMQLPRKPHLDAVRRTLRYVRATLDHALFYAADAPLALYGYTDADWAGSIADRRSTSGFMFSFGSAAVTWSSNLRLLCRAQRLSTGVQQLRRVRLLGYAHYLATWECRWTSRLSSIATTLVAYSWLGTHCSMPGPNI